MCACVSRDAVMCWALRYNEIPTLVHETGGPCPCSCHDDFDEDMHDELDDLDPGPELAG